MKHPPPFETKEEAMRNAPFYRQPNMTLEYVKSSDGQIISVEEIEEFNKAQR
jgi:hypothetical protein